MIDLADQLVLSVYTNQHLWLKFLEYEKSEKIPKSNLLRIVFDNIVDGHVTLPKITKADIRPIRLTDHHYTFHYARKRVQRLKEVAKECGYRSLRNLLKMVVEDYIIGL